MFLKSLPQLLLGFSSLLVTSQGLYLGCNYLFMDHGDIENVYTCIARVISFDDTYHVTNVSTNHLEGQNDSTVQGLIFNQTLKFSPRSVHLFFENIEIYVSRSTGSPDLTREHLKGFSNLRVLDFGNNALNIIENDMFIANPLLELIYFDSNPMRHIAPQVFDHLNELHTLYMDNTTCINQTANNRSEVETLMFRVILSCPPTFEMTETKIINGSGLQSKVQERLDFAIDPIETMLLEIKEEQETLDRRIRDLENGVPPTITISSVAIPGNRHRNFMN